MRDAERVHTLVACARCGRGYRPRQMYVPLTGPWEGALLCRACADDLADDLADDHAHDADNDDDE